MESSNRDDIKSSWRAMDSFIETVAEALLTAAPEKVPSFLA